MSNTLHWSDVARSLSVPNMQFEKSSYTAKEKDNLLHIPIIRSGDLSFKSSVRCFTRTMSAMVMDDFEERRNADESRITFLKGEKVKCWVKMWPDVCVLVLRLCSSGCFDCAFSRWKTAQFTSLTTQCSSLRRSFRCISVHRSVTTGAAPWWEPMILSL